MPVTHRFPFKQAKPVTGRFPFKQTKPVTGRFPFKQAKPVTGRFPFKQTKPVTGRLHIPATRDFDSRWSLPGQSWALGQPIVSARCQREGISVKTPATFSSRLPQPGSKVAPAGFTANARQTFVRKPHNATGTRRGPFGRQPTMNMAATYNEHGLQ